MTDNKNEEFPIVDEMGNILGAITRGHAHDGSKILHPVVHLHVFNSKGDLYLQHRPHGRISSLISGILPVADMWIWERA